MNHSRYRFFEFNFGVLLISSSAILGRYLLSSSTVVTFWRCAIGGLSLFLLCLLIRESLSFNWKTNGKVLIWTSALMAAHWTSYFYALDFSNVSIALMTLYTFPAVTAIIEPIWYRRRIPMRDFFLAMVALIAVWIIASPSQEGADILLAISFGLFSSVAYSVRNVWITSLTREYSGTTIMTYQLMLMALFLLPFSLNISIRIPANEWPATIFLGVVTTAAGHTLFMRGLKYYKATTASIIACTVPVYAIVLAYFLLGETPSWRTVIGGIIILGVVLFKILLPGKAIEYE